MDLTNIHKVHFIGIGGIGVSAIVRLMLGEEKAVSGSDNAKTEITTELERAGACIFYTQEAKNVPADADLVIYTIAITENNPEFAEAKRLGLTMMSYPQFLGELSKTKFTIAISGTHGKTTTTAMLAGVMIDAGLDPTVILGSLINKTNFILGKSKYLVVEACEYRRSFLNLSPTITIITNIDNDHLDYYKDLADIQSAFRELVEKESNTSVVCDSNDQNVSDMLAVDKSTMKAEVVDYKRSREIEDLMVPGEHNVKNAQAVLSVAKILGIPEESAVKSLKQFSGTWRRFEYKGRTKVGTLVYDDYAHHPTEVKATLQGARAFFKDKKILVIFQPHLYSRTKDHLKEFGTSFADVDEILIAPIYAAREAFDSSITAEMVAEEIRKNGGKAKSLTHFDEAVKYVKEHSFDVVMTMGAGDVYKIGEVLL